MASAPEAIFLLIIELAISGMLSTVEVTSLSAYIFLSAGVRFDDCPTIDILYVFTFFINSSGLISTLKPLIDSSLSIVPPVCPRPLPLILATGTPIEATSGITMRLILSPTPPVECLSTFIPFISERSTLSPESTNERVKSVISELLIP